MRRVLVACWLLAFAGPVIAEPPLEIVELRHRPAEEVVPVLRALLAPGGSLSAFGHRLFVRTTPANLAELRAVLAEIDRPAARLLISVRQTAQGADERREASVSGRIGSDRTGIELPPADPWRAPGVTVRIEDGRRSSDSQTVQQVQTVDGGQARIHAGVSQPLPLRRLWLAPDGAVISETVIWRDLGTGFIATPRIVGERVSIDIAPYDEERAARDGAAHVRRLVTTVEGRLGEWIAVGAGARDAAQRHRGILSGQTYDGSSTNEIWLKVERLED